MGLKERRVQEEMKQKLQSEWLKQVQDAAKFPVAIEVHWDMMVKEDNLHYALESFEEVFIKPLIAGFQDICRDEMGTTALAATLKQIVIKSEKGHSSGTYFASFEKGILTLDHSYSNVDQVADRTKGLIDTLSKNL